MLKRILTILSLSLVPFAAMAEDTSVAGKHYDLISPALRTAEPAKIAAAEYFW